MKPITQEDIDNASTNEECICRVLCEVDGVDPSTECVAVGSSNGYISPFPEGFKYKLWQYRLNHAKAVLQVLT